MPFDVKAFSKAKFVFRTEEVKVSAPGLIDFFKDADPVFVVRGLSGEEMSKAQSAGNKAKALNTLIDAVSGGNHTEQVNALRDSMGINQDSLPEDVAKRIEMLEYGSVEPKIDTQMSVKIFKNFPVDAFYLTNRIMHLSGLGSEVGKPQPSGKEKTSGVPAT